MKFTKITSSLPEKITKKIELVDGKLKKTAAANMVEGKAEVVAVSSLTEFAQALMSTDSSTAFVYGIPNAGDCQLLTKSEYEKRGRPKGFSPRTNDAFRWNAGPSIMFLDYDAVPGEEPMSREDLVASLEHACPGILDAGYIWTTSASAGILDGEGNDLTGISGQRIYIPVKSGLDIPRATEVLEEKLWNAGMGRIEIAKNGAMLKRSLFDFAVYQQSRLDFVGPADLQPPLNQKPKLPMVVERGQLLDTAKVIKHRVQKDSKDAEALVAKAKADATPEAEAVRGSYIDHRSEREASKLGVPVEQVRERLEKLLVGGELSADFVLYTRKGQVTVAEAMADPEAWSGVQCLSPGEEDYRGGDYCGIIHVDENPQVFTLAHGGMTFPFAKVEAPTSEESDAKQDEGPVHALVDTKGNPTFLIRNKAGQYARLNPKAAKTQLGIQGIPDDEADAILHEQAFEHPLVYAGAISGLNTGRHTLEDQNVLVTRELEIPDAKAGDWSFLYNMIDDMFPDAENRDRYMAWLYHAWKSLKTRKWQPLPVMCLGGPKGCGKTLSVTVANIIMGEGTVGKAFKWATGGTSFNAEMLPCNLLEIDDEISSTVKGARDAIGATFKQLAVVGRYSIEAKGQQAFTCPTFWRLFLCCNDEAESLRILPINNAGLADKYLLLRAVKPENPVNAVTGEEREELRRKIREAVPGFLHYMQEADWNTRYTDDRMVVTGWQDPQLMSTVNVMSPAGQLLELIDILNPYVESQGFWEGTAVELKQLLLDCDRTKFVTQNEFKYTNQVGRLLAELAKSVSPERVECLGVRKSSNTNDWRIYSQD
jgi:hypothetical protein